MKRAELNDRLKKEEAIYWQNKTIYEKMKSFILNSKSFYYWKYVKTLRMYEYYFSNRHKNLFYAAMNILYARRFNKLGYKLGIELEKNVFDSGLQIYHTQGIVINGDAKVGKNCKLHGANVIGNKGTDFKAPILGDNVRLGVGAKVLGDVYIEDDVQIGAGAVVLDSCYEKGALLVGIPAKIHKRVD